MNRILIIDDDVELCDLLTEYFTQEGFKVKAVHDSETGISQALSDEPTLIVLDVMLPGKSGFEVLRQIREQSKVPVVMLTARGDEVDRIVGLEMGADDYLPKPFNPRELVARIRAIQRRAVAANEGQEQEGGKILKIGDVELDHGARTVLLGGKPVELTAVEFSMLEILLRRAGQVVNRETLAKEVLGRRLSPFDRSIDVHVSSLRRKIGLQPNGSERIKTIRGTGYQYLIPH
jgi:two-component system response regulator CpxR